MVGPGHASLGDCRAEVFDLRGRGTTSHRGRGASEPAAIGRQAHAGGGPHLPAWRFVQEVSCLGAENLRCGAFAFCVPFVCCLRSGLCFETLRLRFAFERSGRTPKVSCSLNGTRVTGSIDGRDWHSKLTPDIKDAAIAELGRLYGGGASKPITLIGRDFNLKKKEEQLLARKLSCLAGGLVSAHVLMHLRVLSFASRRRL